MGPLKCIEWAWMCSASRPTGAFRAEHKWTLLRNNSQTKRNEAMPIEFEIDSFDPDNLGGFDFPAVGKYHVEANELDEDAVAKSSGNPQMVVDFEVLAGTTADQEGVTGRIYYPLSADAKKFALGLAVALGLTTKEALTAAKKANKAPGIEFRDGAGRQFCLEVTLDNYDGKDRLKVEPFSVWHLDDPAAKDIPKNAAMLAQLGNAAPDPMAKDDDEVF